jgi:hypothetical protein
MKLKQKLLGIALLASLATVTVVVVTASATKGGLFETPGNKKSEVFLVENATHTLEYSLEGVASSGMICNTTVWKGMMEAEAEAALTIVPEKLADCRTTGGIPGSVKFKPNGCALLLYAAKGTTDSTEQTAELSCGVGGQMEIIHGACTITVASQQGLTGITYTKIKFNSKDALTAHFNTKIAIKADGFCPAGTGTVGKISGSVTIDAVIPTSVDLVIT